MSALEHLLMQISDRRARIEAQLRQQAESYCETMAYNLAADGVRPPPWLWPARPGDAAGGRHDHKELNQEQLISDILLPPSTTFLANRSTVFTVPALKGDYVSQSDGLFTEMCAVNKHLYATGKGKAMDCIYQNCAEKNSDMMVEPEVVEACGEIDPFARVQRSKSRQRDLEVRLSKNKKSTNHLDEAVAADGNSGARAMPRSASMNAGFIEKPSDSLYVHNEDGPRVIQSTSITNELKCEKLVKPTRLFDFIDDAAQATEIQMDCSCTPALSLNVDINAPNNKVEMVQCSTGHVKAQLSDETHHVLSALEVRIGEESTMDENFCRRTSSSFASEGADFVKNSSNAGNRVTQSRSMSQKSDCLEKSAKPTKNLHLVEDDTHDAAENDIERRPMPTLEVDNFVCHSTDDMAPHICATETLGKELLSDAAHPFQLGLTLMHGTDFKHSEISLVEPKSLRSECIKECHLDENSTVPLRKESLICSSDVRISDLEAKDSVEDDSYGVFKKSIDSISRQPVEENSLCTADSLCGTEEVDITTNKSLEKRRLDLKEMENYEYLPTSSNKPSLIPSSPIEATCWISGNASMHSTMIDGGASVSNVKHDVCSESSSERLEKHTLEDHYSGKLVKESPPETNHLVEANHVLPECLKKHDLRSLVPAMDTDPVGSYSEIVSTNLETVQLLKHLSRRDSTAELMRDTEEKACGTENEEILKLDETTESECLSHDASRNSEFRKLPDVLSLKEKSGSFGTSQKYLSTAADCMVSSSVCVPGHCIVVQGSKKKHSFGSPVQNTGWQKCKGELIGGKSGSSTQLASTSHNDGSTLFLPESNDALLLEAEEVYAASLEVKKKSASRLTTTPDATISQNSALEFRHSLRNSTTKNNISGSSRSHDSILPSNKFAECLSTQGTMVDNTPNTAEVINALPESRYLLRSSRSNDDVAEMNSAKLTLKNHSSEILIAPEKSRYFLRSVTSQEKNVTSSKSTGNSEVCRSTQSMKITAHAPEISWPKRKKKKGRSYNIFATSPRLRLKPLHTHSSNCSCKTISEKSDCRCRKTAGYASGETFEHEPFHLSRLAETDISTAVSRSPLELLHQREERCITEAGSYLKEEDEVVAGPSPIDNIHEELFTDQEGVSSRACQKDKMKITDCEDNFLHGENILEHTNLKSFYCDEKFSEREMRDGDASGTRLSDLDNVIVDCDETMPEYEGFSIGVPSTAAGEIFFSDSDFSRLTEERASMLEELCRSRSIFTPASHTLKKNKIYEVPDVYQSLPSGLLEHMSLTSSFKYSNFSMKQLRASEDGRLTGLCCNLGSEFDGSFSERSSLHSKPASSAKSGWVSRKPPLTPPVQKFSQRIIPGRGHASSEKVSLNPELTCFRIDEDSSTNDENGFLDELNTSGVMNDSREINDLADRKALADVSAVYNNSPNMVSVSKEFSERGSPDFMKTKTSYGTHVGAYSNLGKGDPSKSKSKLYQKNHALSISGERFRKAVGSLRNSSSKPELSGKANQRNRSRMDQVKGSKPNNIVSNISSFIPLVRQKQEAAVPPKGKKDIKVKALEAAEAAKRLEEKKQLERDKRKAATKLERERLEQENVRRLELEQKKKKEEKRTKEADTAARKRQREEGKKVQERKRRCTEMRRKLQKEQDEKVRFEKEESEMRHKAADEKERRKKEPGEAAQRQPKSEKDIAGFRKPREAEGTSKLVSEDARAGCASFGAQDSYIISTDAQKVARNSDSSQETIQNGISINRGYPDLQSYEMSPYIDSDDEDGEEESKRKRKYVPVWARRKSLDQTILSKKDLDPSVIFSSKRSFNLNEVLVPRIRRRPL